MDSRRQELIAFFKRHAGAVRFADILKAGFHPDSLRALEKEKKVEKITRGLYRLPHYTLGPYPDLVAASLQAPKGVICLLSALAFYEATDEIPKAVALAIPQKAHANRIQYPPVKFYHFAPEAWKAGIEKHVIKGHEIRIYNLAKTIADCFKFRNRMGVNIAREALKFAVAEKNIKPKEIMRYAAICRVDKIIKPILETVL